MYAFLYREHGPQLTLVWPAQIEGNSQHHDTDSLAVPNNKNRTLDPGILNPDTYLQFSFKGNRV